MNRFITNPSVTSPSEIEQAWNAVQDGKRLLKEGNLANERAQILPFFKNHPILCNVLKAAIGQDKSGEYAFELRLLQGYQADLVIIQRTHASQPNKVLLVEFESGSPNTLFRVDTPRRTHKRLGTKVVDAMTQIVDWLYDFDESRKHDHYLDLFGENPTFSYLIVAGRNEDCEGTGKKRLVWLTKKLKIDSSEQGAILSYDDLFEAMHEMVGALKNPAGHHVST